MKIIKKNKYHQQIKSKLITKSFVDKLAFVTGRDSFILTLISKQTNYRLKMFPFLIIIIYWVGKIKHNQLL